MIVSECFPGHKKIKFAYALLTLAFAIAGCATAPSEKISYDDLPLHSHAVALKEAQPAAENLPQLGEHSTLNDYLLYAALNNPGLEAAFLNWKAALEKIPQVTALPDPRFTYSYFIQSVETRVGPQNQRFAIAQTFPWLGKLKLQGSAAAEAAHAEKERYEAVKLKLFFQVKDAYYEYYYLARSIAVTQANLDLMKELEGVARIQYASGFALYSNVVRAQVELGKLEDRVKTLQDLHEPIVAKLNAALNRPADASLPWPKKIEQEQVAFTREQLVNWLKESNPDLKAVDFLAEREKQNLDLAKKSYFPDFTVAFETIDTGQAINPGTPGSGKDPMIATVSINLPIWWDKYSAGEREAVARYRAFRREHSNRENSLVADLKLAVYKYQDAERKINLYKDTLVPKAEQSLEVSLQAYEAGLGTFLDLIDSIRSLLEFQLSYERAFTDKAQRLAELKMLVGKEIPRTNASSKSAKDATTEKHERRK